MGDIEQISPRTEQPESTRNPSDKPSELGDIDKSFVLNALTYKRSKSNLNPCKLMKTTDYRRRSCFEFESACEARHTRTETHAIAERQNLHALRFRNASFLRHSKVGQVT